MRASQADFSAVALSFRATQRNLNDNATAGKAVWDEFVGMWITCLLLPKEALWLGAAFLLFRVLDIVKPWPARKLESLHGGFGIMFDDVMVAVYGAAFLNIGRFGLLQFANG